MIGTPVVIPCISSRHLEPGAWVRLRHLKQEHILAAHPGGLFLIVPLAHNRAGLPKDILDICEAFDKDPASLGWIMFDYDGDVVPGLPTYD